ncbi:MULTISPECIES: TonB-dependent receptor [unclassified Pseudoxanthomonas]|uniref:TonB-dependent receptor plug domain-containing protein n=1 Tax=unclassified Pseudoxanthomonas TaxID=2645906 RepID=UPI0008E7D8D4|nr:MULTISPECIES: TonB-dependent receptor [unclassified Pseudoxanthomonas]PPJ43357.1 TonB-dependent receptor [Pseudoxanthomonas sp. KAs_5_3]SFV34959.1 iron complex outermembrane recepter protein [Pseudoxanthomonas sp. YR558]
MTNLKKLPNAIKFALFASAASLATGNAFAQEAASSDTEAKTLDRIEVTGSRLKRADIEGAVPVIVIDRASIDASGDVSVADVLRDSTFASFGNFKPQSGSSAQSLASIDLRGLGSGRTLVLIDGRRAPTNPMSASSGTDVNAIPLAAVERIEILSDGASAVYGSDAIGGVVNIILRKDFNGAELRYGKGQTKVTGGDLEDASAVFGVSSDRGRLVGGASKSSRGMVFTRDQIGGQTLGVSIYGNNVYNPNTRTVGAVPGFDCTGTFWAQPNGRCSFDFNSVAANEASVDNTSVFAFGEYQINDDWNVYLSATNTRVESFGRYAPVPGLVWASEGTSQDLWVGDGRPTYYYHRFAAAGNRDNFTTANNADFLVGFQGQLTDKIAVEFGARRTNYKYNELGYGYIIQSLANQQIDAGNYLLTDPFGASQQTLDSFTATIGRDSFFKTKEWFGNVSFDLFEMGGGISNAIVGAEYREEQYQDIYDSLSRAGVVLGSSGGSSAGGREVSSAYFEWLFPFTSSFDVTVAGRYDKYSDYGNDFSPKVAARWQPLDNLTFRGSYGQGFRAPGLDILTAARSFSAEPVQDPASCVFAGLNADCTNGGGVPQSVQVDTFFIANPGLSSEQSTQWSLGVVYDPVDWLDLSLDYYNIEVEDNISQISAQDIINSDLDPDTYGAIPAGLSITRDPVTGRVLEIIAGYGNVGTLKTDGYDFRANTDFDFGGAGKLKNRLSVSYINKYEITDVSGTIDYAGRLGTPDLRANLQNEWSLGDFSAIWGINYIDGQQTPGGFGVGGYATNDLQLSWKAPWNATIAVGATNIGDRYPELVAYDGRPWNFYLYDAYGRTTYIRYTQQF